MNSIRKHTAKNYEQMVTIKPLVYNIEKIVLDIFIKRYVHFYEGRKVENFQYNCWGLVRHNGIKFPSSHPS